MEMFQEGKADAAVNGVTSSVVPRLQPRRSTIPQIKTEMPVKLCRSRQISKTRVTILSDVINYYIF